MTVAQIAEESGFSARTVLRWIADGDLAAFRFPGGRLRVRESDYVAMQSAGVTVHPVGQLVQPPLLSNPLDSEAGGS